MANTIQFKRGLEAGRSGVTPSAGEPLWTTDGKKLYVGDGSTAGGIAIDTGITELSDDTTPQLGGDLDLNGNALDFPTTANIADCLDEDNMASDSATALATQQSIKAYVDSKAGPEFADDTIRIVDNADATKKVAFQVSGLTSSTTRTVTFPDSNLDLTPTTGSYLGSTATVDGGSW